jgi:hypothetical protein
MERKVWANGGADITNLIAKQAARSFIFCFFFADGGGNQVEVFTVVN